MLNKKLIALMAVLFFGACSDGDLSQNAQDSATEESESSKSSEVKSSSSKKVAKSSSSTKSKTSSSSKSKNTTTDSEFGTCAPARTPVDAGDTISWVMKPKDPSSLLSAVSVWTMEDGSPDYGSGKGALGRSQQTKYTASGDYTASVVVRVGDGTYQIDCEPLHVNGKPKSSSSAKSSSSKSNKKISGKCELIRPDVVLVGDEVIWRYVPDEGTLDKGDFEWDFDSDSKKIEVVDGALSGTGLPEIVVSYKSAGSFSGPVLSFAGKEFDCNETFKVFKINVEPASSSSKKSSSSSFAVSSSSEIPMSSTIPRDFGTCAPEKQSVFKGEAVSWVLKAKDPTLLISAYSVWTMKGGTPDNGSNKGMNGRTQQTTYTASGDYEASVQVSVGAANYNIKCDPLHVNGDPITRCECTTAETSVDFTANPNVTWAVSGCKTGAGIGLTYEWDGLAGETTYSLPFTAAHPGYTPKLVVKSTDNSMLEVACPTVKVTDGPEYIFEINDKIPLESQEIKNGGCISIVGRWNNSLYRPTISVYCSMNATTSPVSFEMTYGTKVYKEKSYSSWGFSNAGGEIGPLNDGNIAFDNICVRFTGAETVTCHLML